MQLDISPSNVTNAGAMIGRTDCQGFFVMRYSDDGAESWSTERILVPYAPHPRTPRRATLPLPELLIDYLNSTWLATK